METLEQEPTLKEVFVVDSEEKVNWVLSLLGALDAESARIKAQTERRQKQIASEKQSLLYQYEADLRAFADKEIARQGGKRKSVVLMQGTLAFQSKGATVKIIDEATAFAYAQNAGEGTKVVLDKDAYRKTALKAMRENGELLPGIEPVDAQELFLITFNKEGETDNAPSEE